MSMPRALSLFPVQAQLVRKVAYSVICRIKAKRAWLEAVELAREMAPRRRFWIGPVYTPTLEQASRRLMDRELAEFYPEWVYHGMFELDRAEQLFRAASATVEDEVFLSAEDASWITLWISSKEDAR